MDPSKLKIYFQTAHIEALLISANFARSHQCSYKRISGSKWKLYKKICKKLATQRLPEAHFYGYH
jgi:hypothetical protein